MKMQSPGNYHDRAINTNFKYDDGNFINIFLFLYKNKNFLTVEVSMNSL
jgi:hypothetical protein